MIRVIAECGVNYPDASLDEAKRMIKSANIAGAKYCKFQLFNESTIKTSPLKEKLANYILSEDDVKEIRKVADATKIGLVLTPMYDEAIELAAKYADLIKIRFADHKNEDLINHVAATGKELLVSVPRRPVNAYNPWVHYLYCIPLYPPAPEDFNLEIASCCDGFSSHFPYTVFDLAFAINQPYRDSFIEKHVMIADQQLEKTGKIVHPVDYKVSITFQELANLISQLELIERMERIRI